MSPPVRLRVATYNIRKAVGLDWRRRPDRILAVLDEIRADVVALQEVDKRFGSRQSVLSAEALAAAGWRAAGFPRLAGSLGWRGNAILFGPAARLDGARAIELPALEPRGAAIADLSLRGCGIRVVGAHLGLTARRRMQQAAALVGEIGTLDERPTILMGDMNEWGAFAGCMSVLGRSFALSPPTPTFHASMPVAPLDRIAATHEFEFFSCAAHDTPLARRASDHLPLVADLALRPQDADT